MNKYINNRIAKRVDNPVFTVKLAQMGYDSTGDYRIWIYNNTDEEGYDVYCIAETNSRVIVADHLYADDVEDWYCDLMLIEE